MASNHVVILSGGGVRSLVATALTLESNDSPRATFLHIADGRDNHEIRLKHVKRQAEHFGSGRVRELVMTHLFGHGHGMGPDNTPMGSLVAVQLLTAALSHARFGQASCVIWPAAYNLDDQAMARATEQGMLCEQFAQLEAVPMPELETPLLEMSDQQVIELGSQLQVPWHLAWCCLMANEQPCRICPGCRRRKNAFEEAGIIDPLDQKKLQAAR
jgi:hypothetical protein